MTLTFDEIAQRQATKTITALKIQRQKDVSHAYASAHVQSARRAVAQRRAHRAPHTPRSAQRIPIFSSRDHKCFSVIEDNEKNWDQYQNKHLRVRRVAKAYSTKELAQVRRLAGRRG